MTTSKQPLKPEDFPVNAEGEKIKKQDGTPIANTDDPAVAADVAERLNDEEDRREEDKWSAWSLFFQLAAQSVEQRADQAQQRLAFGTPLAPPCGNFDLTCGDDESAKARARKLVVGHAVELWDGGRTIATFEPSGENRMRALLGCFPQQQGSSRINPQRVYQA
jgi:hypothetical protein